VLPGQVPYNYGISYLSRTVNILAAAPKE
jgi:hypothetical protein